MLDISDALWILVRHPASVLLDWGLTGQEVLDMEGGLQFKCPHCGQLVDSVPEHGCAQRDLARLREIEGLAGGVASEPQEDRPSSQMSDLPRAAVSGKFDKRGYQRAYMRQRRLKGDG